MISLLQKIRLSILFVKSGGRSRRVCEFLVALLVKVGWLIAYGY